jgi:type II secretory pathway pseudopilin PulG
MLDVHPPHHAATTWRDFFIHIATIVIGLLIAVGLEQTVEYVHHRHQLHKAREAIYAEIEAQATRLETAIASTITAEQTMQRNAAILRTSHDHDSTPTSALIYKWGTPYPRSNAWQDAKADGSVGYMAPQERAAADFIYGDMDFVEKFSLSWLQDSKVATAITARAPTVGGLTAQEREELLKLTAEIEGEIVSCRMLLLTDQNAVRKYLSVPAQSGKQTR